MLAGPIIREAREEAGYSREGLARRINTFFPPSDGKKYSLTPGGIKQLESREKEPSRITLKKLLAVIPSLRKKSA